MIDIATTLDVLTGALAAAGIVIAAMLIAIGAQT